MILKEAIKIRAQPGSIFHFFEEMEQNYVRWHPDHVLFRWVKSQGLEEGHQAYFEERIAGELKKMTIVYTRVTSGQYIEFAPARWLFRLLLPRMLFRIEEAPDGCVLTQEIHVRIGPVGARLNKKGLDAVRQHMKEEGENLKRIVER